MAKYYYTNMISALATGQISYRDAMCEILKRLCDLENEKVQYQADWTETDSASPSYIQHKPSVQEFQADWNEQNSLAYGYIQNKPSVLSSNNETNTTTLPPPNSTNPRNVLRSSGIWGSVFSSIIGWGEGINTTENNNFQNVINKFQNQANWTETDPNSPSFIQNKPVIPEPTEQVQADWTEMDVSRVSFIKNKPSVQEFQADWNENNSLEYGYIQNKPSIPPAPVQSDWAETNTSSLAYIKNKPSIPSGQKQSDWTETDSASPSYIQHKPSVQEFQADWNETNSTAYGYIQNKPEIPEPTEQVQADWTETDDSQVSFIKNKPGITTAGTTSGTLVPPTQGANRYYVLRTTGEWGGLPSNLVYWWAGIDADNADHFRNILLQYGTYPRASWSRYTQCFAYLQALPAGASNTWGCQIVQEWIPGKFWHFKGWVFKSVANNSSITTPFFSYGINLDCVVEHTDLTAEQFAIAYNDNRVYSVAKKIDGYQIDGGTDWFGRVNLTDTEIGGVLICNYDGDATTGYKGVLRFGGWKYSGSTMALTDYPLAQQGIGAFEFDIWVNSAS